MQVLRPRAILRWAARLSIVLVSGSVVTWLISQFWQPPRCLINTHGWDFALALIGELMGSYLQDANIAVPAVLLFLAAIAGMIIAWRWRFTGATISLFSLVILTGTIQFQPTPASFVLAVPGVLSLADGLSQGSPKKLGRGLGRILGAAVAWLAIALSIASFVVGYRIWLALTVLTAGAVVRGAIRSALGWFPSTAVILSATGVFLVPWMATTKVNPNDHLTYVWVPPGSFTMGCSPKDINPRPEDPYSTCWPQELPSHQVTLRRGFWMGRDLVTRTAYDQVLLRGESSSNDSGQSPGSAEMTTDGIARVVWENADTFCRDIGGRLPTEAEWEYAARVAPTRTRNAFGLHMKSTVASEWTMDWFAPYSPTEATDPTGPDNGQRRAVRNFFFGKYSQDHRPSYRYGADPNSDTAITFRCVLESTRPVSDPVDLADLWLEQIFDPEECNEHRSR